MVVAVDVAMQFEGKETAAERRKREAKERREAREALEEEYMLPYKDRPRELRKFATFDIESKKKDTQLPGFERPFMACFYDGKDYFAFRDDPKHKGKSYRNKYWHDPGGCIDKLCKLIFGIRECYVCRIGRDDYRWGRCEACIEARKRFQKSDWILTAHNGGNFDNLFVLGWVRRHKRLFDCEIINVQSRMLILTVKPRTKVEGKTRGEGWCFADSVALIPLSLKEIGKTFCKSEEARKMEFNLGYHEDDPRWEEYNRRDCYALHEGLGVFRNLIEGLGGTIGATAASTAMQLFRRKFQKIPVHRNLHLADCNGKCRRRDCPIHECRDAAAADRVCHGCAHDFVKDAFFGGRTEMFRTGGKRLFYYDINSSYPAAMKLDMPVGKMREMNGGTIDNLRAMAQRHVGFVECVIDIPRKCYLPPLPYRLRKKSGEMKLIFPVGRLYGTWSWIEIEEALKIGSKIISIGRSVWYQKAKLFDKMIDKLYSYRQKICKKCKGDISEGKCYCAKKTWDPGMDYCAKLMMNSTFGKLGINPVREMLVFPDTMEEIDESVIMPPPSQLGESGVRKQHVMKADYLCPQIPAFITADARVRLYRGLLSVLKRGGKIIYADTDSCLATLPVNPQGSNLGQWKLEYKNFDAEILLPKTYLLRRHNGDCTDSNCKGCATLHKKDGTCPGKEICEGCKSPVEVKMKGVPRGIQNEETWKKLLKGQKVFFDRLTMHRGMLKRKWDSPEEVQVHKSMKSKYDKRTFFNERGKKLPGGNTLPLVINDPATIEDARAYREVQTTPPSLKKREKVEKKAA